MKELLAKIRAARPNTKTKCQLVAEVYAETETLLNQIEVSIDDAPAEAETRLQAISLNNENLDISKFDILLDEIKQILEAVEKLFLPLEVRELLKTLGKRFKEKPNFHEDGRKSLLHIKWEDVERRLRKAPLKKLKSLLAMEKTGGEPDVIKIDEKTGEIIFYDCSAESPTGRRGCVYDQEGKAILKRDHPKEKYNGNAVDMAKKMGAELLTETEYRELQTKGKFDQNSWSWLATPVGKRKEGIALGGYRRDDVGVGEHDPDLSASVGAWRASLRI